MNLTKNLQWFFGRFLFPQMNLLPVHYMFASIVHYLRRVIYLILFRIHLLKNHLFFYHLTQNIFSRLFIFSNFFLSNSIIDWISLTYFLINIKIINFKYSIYSEHFAINLISLTIHFLQNISLILCEIDFDKHFEVCLWTD